MSSSGVHISSRTKLAEQIQQNRIVREGNGHDATYKTTGKQTKHTWSRGIMQPFTWIRAKWASPCLPCFGFWKVIFGFGTLTKWVILLFCMLISYGLCGTLWPSTYSFECSWLVHLPPAGSNSREYSPGFEYFNVDSCANSTYRERYLMRSLSHFRSLDDHTPSNTPSSGIYISSETSWKSNVNQTER